MKATFIFTKEDYEKESLDEIAAKYATKVILDDDGISRFLIVLPKFQIKERLIDEKYHLYIWGAKKQDIEYLKTKWGNPARTEAQRLSPKEFAHELMGIRGVENMTKEQIMDVMELNDRQFTQYQRILKNVLRRPDQPEILVKAAQIMNKE